MDSLTPINEPWVDPEDLLDVRKYAGFLTSFLTSQNKSFVLNINAEWGFGKTFFIRNWAEEIGTDHPVVYINAWETDHSDDPLLAVVASINSKLEEEFNDNKEALSALAEMLKSSGRFLKQVAPIIAKGLIKKAFTQSEGEQLIGTFEDSDSDIVGDFVEASTKRLLTDHKVRSKSMSEFRTALETLIKTVTKSDNPEENNTGKKKKPLFVFIDELDRCRPTYAIELLENVKHLFTVNDAIFVIATDSTQLQHSVRAVYGQNFGGAEYLRRFFHREFTLPLPKYDLLIRVITQDFDDYNCFVDTYFIPDIRFPEDRAIPDNTNSNQIDAWFIFYSASFKVSLRSLKQIYDQFLAIVNSNNQKWHMPLLLYLLFLYAKNREIFDALHDYLNSTNFNSAFIEQMPDSNETICWRSNYEVININQQEFMTASKIGTLYLEKIFSTKNDSWETIRDIQIENVTQFNDFVYESIRQQRLNRNCDEVKYVDYFEAIKIAGLLR